MILLQFKIIITNVISLMKEIKGGTPIFINKNIVDNIDIVFVHDSSDLIKLLVRFSDVSYFSLIK